MPLRIISYVAGHKVITENIGEEQYQARVFKQGSIDLKALFTSVTRERVETLAFNFIERENDPSTIDFTPQLFADLKVAVAAAEEVGDDEFTFEGRDMPVAYAKYLIEFLEPIMGKHGGATASQIHDETLITPISPTRQ